jgi:rRNA-processing protein EBP2
VEEESEEEDNDGEYEVNNKMLEMEIEEDDTDEWDEEARALRQAIAEGVFDNIESNQTKNQSKLLAELDENSNDDSEQEEEEDDDDDDDDDDNKRNHPIQNTKALHTVAAQLSSIKNNMPWPEKFDITPDTKLPFGDKDEATGLIISVHDDLKREVAFYNLALEAVHMARKKCDEVKIPFSRPDDFFAEMVKTDEHMAKIKDRLIFETKKMEAFEQRKTNREHKLRSKEAQSHRQSEKAKAKRKHMQDVQDWAKHAASNRIGQGKVHDNDDDYLNRMSGGGPSKKRQAYDKKYGYGGKRGRFKQNDKKTLNDFSSFNPHGGKNSGKKSAGGAKRKGKRARDAAKAKR